MILFVGCEMTNSSSEYQKIDIKNIAQSEIFDDFKSKIINFNEPYITRLESITSEELNTIYSISKKSSNIDQYSVLIKEMGYASIEDYEKKMESMFKSLNNLINKFPELKEATVEERETAFKILFTEQASNAHKSLALSSNCTYDFSYCMSMAKGYYYAASGGCATGLLGGPIGAVAAVGCQLANTAYYEGKKMECAHEYNQCNNQNES